MLEFICSIPEHIGWVMVGAVGMLAFIMLCKLGKLFVQMWREYHEDEEEEEDFFETA